MDEGEAFDYQLALDESKWKKWKKPRTHKKITKRSLLPRWQHEVLKRGTRIGNEWYWSYYDVRSFCNDKEKGWAVKYISSRWRGGVSKLQVELFTYTGEYIHLSRKNYDINHYKWLLQQRIAKFVGE